MPSVRSIIKIGEIVAIYFMFGTWAIRRSGYIPGPAEIPGGESSPYRPP